VAVLLSSYWAPERCVLRPKESDDPRAHTGGDMHGAAVIAEHYVEVAAQCGELADAEWLVNDDGLGVGGLADCAGRPAFARTCDEEDFDAELVVQLVTGGGEVLQRPDSGSATGPGWMSTLGELFWRAENADGVGRENFWTRAMSVSLGLRPRSRVRIGTSIAESSAR